MQTWEYAPQFALRTYAYLLPMAGVAKCYQTLLDVIPSSFIQHIQRLLMSTELSSTAITSTVPSDNKPLLFALLRSSLSITSCYAELSFVTSIHDAIHPQIAYLTAFIQLCVTGNFHAHQAYLPSSTVMILWQLSTANQFRGYHGYAIGWGLLAVLGVGWPFCAVLFVSTGFWALWVAYTEEVTVGDSSEHGKMTPYRAVSHVLIRTVLHTIFIQAFVFAIDYHYYGRFVSPIWNIFSYNARGGGDELYGIEPLSYYFKNIALNFNVVGILGIVSLPILLVKNLMKQRRGADHLKLLGLIPMYIWMAIVLPRPHKEERFLFPIYPMLSFGAAITLDEILDVTTWILARIRSDHEASINSKSRLIFGLVFLFPSAIISISRSLALHHYYTAPLALYHDLFYHTSKELAALSGIGLHVCTGGEWYRFPSSFFLPDNVQLSFLKSSFVGQLPQPFTVHGSTVESLAVQSGRFNDANEEVMDRYIDISECSFVIEMVSTTSDESSKPECLQYMAADTSGSWSRISTFKYLDAQATTTLHRILYLPFGREGQVQYMEYNLYSRSTA